MLHVSEMICKALHPMSGTHLRMLLAWRGKLEEANHLGKATGWTTESVTEPKRPGIRSTSTHRSLWAVLIGLLPGIVSEWLAIFYLDCQSNLLLATVKGTSASCDTSPFYPTATVDNSDFTNNRIFQRSPNNSYQNGPIIIRRSQKSLISESTGTTRGTPPPRQSQ